MSRFENVAMCAPCWYSRMRREPYRLRDDAVQLCWFCGAETRSGIYVRTDVEVREAHEIDELIERSSLGTEEAKRLRAQADPDDVAQVLRRVAELESEHVYISTACEHERHDECRMRCKFCSAACECDCHQEESARGRDA